MNKVVVVIGLLMLTFLLVACEPESSSVYFLESGSGADVLGSNVTLVDASECGDGTCNTLIEVFT